MKLFSISDCDLRDCWYEGWWAAVWAHNEAEALRWALRNYGGECPKGQDPGLRVVSVADLGYKPENPDTHQEHRLEILRDAGWREDGETACDLCDLYAMGREEFRVCDSCYLCPECRFLEIEDACDDCSSNPKTH